MVPQPKYPCREHYLVRKLTGIKGNMTVNFRFAPRPNYAQSLPHLRFDTEQHSIDVPLDENATLRLFMPENAWVLVEDGSAKISIPVVEGEISE